MPSALPAAGGRAAPLEMEAGSEELSELSGLSVQGNHLCARSLGLQQGQLLRGGCAGRSLCCSPGAGVCSRDTEQPLISRKLTKGPSFRRVKAQGTPSTLHRISSALQPPQLWQTGTQGESAPNPLELLARLCQAGQDLSNRETALISTEFLPRKEPSWQCWRIN